jgi:tRNA G18 (ribose-2'-O)-methylase SpoU
MRCSLRVVPLRTLLALLRPGLAQFSRQASLTSAINRGIRKTRGGLYSLESQRPARPSGKTREDLPQSPTWRTGIGDREGSRRSEHGFRQKSRENERGGKAYGRNQESPKWQSNSDNVRNGERAQGSHADQRQAEKDDHILKQTPLSSPFDWNNSSHTRETGSQSTNTSLAGSRPNPKERRATIFGKKTWSGSSPGERSDGGESFEQFTADDLKYNGRKGSAGRESLRSFESNRYANELQPKPIRRTRDGRGTWEEKQEDLEGRRRKRRDNESEDRRGAFTDVKGRREAPNPRVQVPLAVPYTTAGSEFLYGTHVVKAALQSGRRKLYKLYMYQGENSQGEQVEPDNSIYKLALAAGVKVSKVTGDWERLLDKMSDQRPHNGYILEASPVPKLPVTALENVENPSETFGVEVGHQSAEELAVNSTFEIHGPLATLPSVGGAQRYPFLLMLDRIRDPGNLGSIIRSAYFLGAEAIVIIEHGTAPIGPVALKSSASAAEHLPLLTVRNEHMFMRKSQENGWKFLAATSPDSPSAGVAGSKPLQLSDVTTALQDGPYVLVLGSEEGGIRPQLQRIVNGTIGITSGRGSAQGLDSLNVGVAAALLMQNFLHGSKRAASQSEGPPAKDIPKPASEKMFEL